MWVVGWVCGVGGRAGVRWYMAKQATIGAVGLDGWYDWRKLVTYKQLSHVAGYKCVGGVAWGQS